MRKKNYIALALAVALCLTMSVSASASYEPVETDDYYGQIMLTDGVVTRGLNEPTREWDWNDGVFSSYFIDVKGGIYSNFYFTDARILYLTIDDIYASGSTTLMYYLNDMTNNTSQSGQLKLSEGDYDGRLERQFNVSPNHKYCIFIRTNNNRTIDGSITLSATLA